MMRNAEKLFSALNRNVYSACSSQYRDSISLIKLFSNSSISKRGLDLIPISKENKIELNGKGSAKILRELLNLRPIVAKDIVVKYKKFHKIPRNSIKENYEHLLSCNVLIDTLQKCPEVLAESDVPSKITVLKKLQYDINITIPLLCVPYKRLKMCIDEGEEGMGDLNQRIKLLSELFEVNIFDICQILTKRSFLLSLNLDQISNNVKLLTDNGITKADIIKDLWVLRYTYTTIKERLDLAKNNNIDILKTWMVRAQPEIFETYIRRRSDKKLILGDGSLTQYLSERLDCTEELAKYMISKQPALQNKSLKKMNEMIDYLFEYGFKPIHICRIPKILLHGVETTRKRLKELESKGIHLDSLYILTKSQRQYMQYCESLVNKNKLKNS